MKLLRSNPEQFLYVVERFSLHHVIFLHKKIEVEGLDILYSSYFTTTERFLDLPRKQEIYALINRMRKINIAPKC